MKIISLILAGACAAPLAQAHITLEPASAAASAYQKLSFRVGHGCEGSPTTGITILLPDAVTGAKPMPKAGWSIGLAEAKLATPLESHGKTITSAVREISWKGGVLPDAYYDEFSIQVKLPEAPGKYYFKVTQLCEKGRVEWRETPAAAAAPLKLPAPALEVVPASGQMHIHGAQQP